MNPFEVQKTVMEMRKNNEHITIEEFSRRCGVRMRHVYLRMSKEMFECPECGGFPRHWVKGLQLHSFITLWFYQPPKETDFSPEYQIYERELEEPESLTDISGPEQPGT